MEKLVIGRGLLYSYLLILFNSYDKLLLTGMVHLLGSGGYSMNMILISMFRECRF